MNIYTTVTSRCGKSRFVPIINLSPQIRTVVIPTKNRKRTFSRPRTRSKPKQSTYQEFQLKAQERELDKKINEIQAFARSLKIQIAKKQEAEVKAEINDIENEVEDEDVDILYNELLGDEITSNNNRLLLSEENNSISLFDTPAQGISISPALLERIGDAVKSIVSKENQNWNSVVAKLYSNEQGLQNLSLSEIDTFLKQIPLGKIQLQSIEHIMEMLSSANITYDEQIYDFLMKHLAENNEPTKVKALFDELVAKGFTPSKYSYGHLIKAYSKSNNIDRINLTLNKMYEEGIEPSVIVYTNVLKLSVDLKDYKQAEDIFQMMKFRSVESKPDIETYNTMIELAYRKNDFFRANDLYKELLQEGLTPTVFTLTCLARLCSKKSEHILKGWQFIIEINERKLEPTISTFEVMLRLAAKDGDLELARAMYLKIFEMQSSSDKYLMNESSVFLLMAYRDFQFNKTPQLFHYREGAIIRRNTIALVDFLGLHQNMVNDPVLSKQREKYPPLLPLRNLVNTKQVIAESNAVWAHHLLHNPGAIVTPSIVTYMRIAVEHNDEDEFLRRYETFTYPNEELYKNKVIIENADKSTESEENSSTNVESQPPALKFIEDKSLKIERNSEIYLTLLSGGRRFKDLSICEKAWLERGEYRKTIKYQKIPENIRKQLDYKFAYEMVTSLLQLDLVYDAVHVVRTSERQFKWTFYVLKPLYQKLIELGDDTVASEISMICNRALFKYDNKNYID